MTSRRLRSNRTLGTKIAYLTSNFDQRTITSIPTTLGLAVTDDSIDFNAVNVTAIDAKAVDSRAFSDSAHIPSGEVAQRVPASLFDKEYWSQVISGDIELHYSGIHGLIGDIEDIQNVEATDYGIKFNPSEAEKARLYLTGRLPIPPSGRIYATWTSDGSVQLKLVCWEEMPKYNVTHAKISGGLATVLINTSNININYLDMIKIYNVGLEFNGLYPVARVQTNELDNTSEISYVPTYDTYIAPILSASYDIDSSLLSIVFNPGEDEDNPEEYAQFYQDSWVTLSGLGEVFDGLYKKKSYDPKTRELLIDFEYVLDSPEPVPTPTVSPEAQAVAYLTDINEYVAEQFIAPTGIISKDQYTYVNLLPREVWSSKHQSVLIDSVAVDSDFVTIKVKNPIFMQPGDIINIQGVQNTDFLDFEYLDGQHTVIESFDDSLRVKIAKPSYFQYKEFTETYLTFLASMTTAPTKIYSEYAVYVEVGYIEDDFNHVLSSAKVFEVLGESPTEPSYSQITYSKYDKNYKNASIGLVNADNFFIDDQVKIEGLGAPYDGLHIITARSDTTSEPEVRVNGLLIADKNGINPSGNISGVSWNATTKTLKFTQSTLGQTIQSVYIYGFGPVTVQIEGEIVFNPYINGVVGIDISSGYSGEYSDDLTIIGTSGGLTNDSLTIIQKSTNIPAGGYQSITYGDGKYVAIGFNGALAFSSDGEIWNSNSMPFGQYTKVVYAAGKFVAVGSNGDVATSSDGITWEDGTIPFGKYLGLTYGGGLFVAVGSGVISTSPDGIVWTKYNVFGNYTAVAYGSSKFIAIGSNNTFAYSTDGISWSTSSSLPTGTYGDIIFVEDFGGDDLFIAVGSSFEGSKVITTNDGGASWEEKPVPFGWYTSIAYNSIGPLFVVSGYNAVTIKSSDLDSWTQVSNTGSPSDVIYADSKYVGVGTNFSTVSGDGVAWDIKVSQQVAAAGILSKTLTVGTSEDDAVFVKIKEANLYTGLVYLQNDDPDTVPTIHPSSSLESSLGVGPNSPVGDINLEPWESDEFGAPRQAIRFKLDLSESIPRSENTGGFATAYTRVSHSAITPSGISLYDSDGSLLTRLSSQDQSILSFGEGKASIDQDGKATFSSISSANFSVSGDTNLAQNVVIGGDVSIGGALSINGGKAVSNLSIETLRSVDIDASAVFSTRYIVKNYLQNDSPISLIGKYLLSRYTTINPNSVANVDVFTANTTTTGFNAYYSSSSENLIGIIEKLPRGLIYSTNFDGLNSNNYVVSNNSNVVIFASGMFYSEPGRELLISAGFSTLRLVAASNVDSHLEIVLANNSGALFNTAASVNRIYTDWVPANTLHSFTTTNIPLKTITHWEDTTIARPSGDGNGGPPDIYSKGYLRVTDGVDADPDSNVISYTSIPIYWAIRYRINASPSLFIPPVLNALSTNSANYFNIYDMGSATNSAHLRIANGAAYGSNFSRGDTISVDPPPAPPPPPPSTVNVYTKHTVSKIISATSSAYFDNGGIGDSGTSDKYANQNSIYQGSPQTSSGTKKSQVAFGPINSTTLGVPSDAIAYEEVTQAYAPGTINAGYKITKIELYLRNRHSYYGSGLQAHWGYSTDTYARNSNSPPAPYTSAGDQDTHFDKGQGKYVTLETQAVNYFASGTIRSILLGLTSGNTYTSSLSNYGWFDGQKQSDPPRLRVTYTYYTVSESQTVFSTQASV